jgi:protein disulfide-isomerase-like protein
MSRTWLFVGLLCALTVNAGDVVILTDKNFDEKVAQGPWLVEFFAPWCGHCKLLEPIWEELATTLKGKAGIGKVDCTVENALRAEYNIEAFPTIKLFHEGRITEFQGRRTVPTFVEFLERSGAIQQAGPSQQGEHNPNHMGHDKHHLQEKTVLRYFQSRGRAEPIRLLFEELGIQYEDVRFSGDEWPQRKAEGIANGLYPFGQLPSVSIGNKNLVQSLAILKFIGRKYGMYGSNEEEQTQMDIVLGGLEDLRNKYGQLVYDQQFNTKREKYTRETLPEWLRYFEAVLRNNGAGRGAHAYFVGHSLSVVDLYAFDVLSMQLGLDPSCLVQYPLLNSFFYTTATRPNIAAYLQSGRRPRHANSNHAQFGNPQHPEDRMNSPFQQS